MNAFQNKILTWYQNNKRDLPWRNTTNPYFIMVSEIMLQQTQVSRVIEKYNQFIARFPTLQDLASASKQELLELWIGLGFNSRALRLQETAKILVKNYGGNIPDDETELRKLPGIGPYTSRAILAFAFNKDVPAIDTNIRRILIHEFDLPENITEKELEMIAWENVPCGKSKDWHNALMDYGACMLTARNTGIAPKSKQSKFIGSSRQTRAAIVRDIVQNGVQEKKILVKQHPHKEFEHILSQLVKEGILEENNNSYSLRK